MTSLVARILLAILMFPVAFCVLIGLAVVLDGFLRPPDDPLVCSAAATCIFIAVYWLVLWYRSVRWTNRRVVWTTLSVFGFVAATVLFVFVLNGVLGLRRVLTGMIAPAFGVSTWLVATVLIWRETPAERADRVRQAAGNALFCPRCGYNMTGLHEARCPECGSRFTLDQLVAAQKQEQLETARQSSYNPPPDGTTST